MFDFLKGFFSHKKPQTFNYPFIVIQFTDSAMDGFVNDNFNKRIVAYKCWGDYEKKKPSFEVPFSDIALQNFVDIYGLPYIEEEFEEYFEFKEETNFGEVSNKI